MYQQPQHALEAIYSWGIQCSRQCMYIGRRATWCLGEHVFWVILLWLHMLSFTSIWLASGSVSTWLLANHGCCSQSICFLLLGSVPAVDYYTLQQGVESLLTFIAHTGWLTKTSWDAIVNKVNELYGRVMQWEDILDTSMCALNCYISVLAVTNVAVYTTPTTQHEVHCMLQYSLKDCCRRPQPLQNIYW